MHHSPRHPSSSKQYLSSSRTASGISPCPQYLVVPLVILAFVFANHFNIVGMGKDFSHNLGVNYHLVLFMGLTIAAMITASIVVIVGSISYIRLIVPNLARQLLKTYRHTELVLGSALFGVITLVGGQMITEHVFSYSIPVSVFITVFGGVYFLFLLLRARRT